MTQETQVKPTPIPWRAEATEDGMIFVASEDWLIARIITHQDGRDVDLANAHLIAAAPLMAKALRKTAAIIVAVENRCMAADGPVTRTTEEITEDELRAIYRMVTQALDAAAVQL